MRNYNKRTENTKHLYEGLQSFFKKNIGIKQMMSKLTPTEMDDYNEEYRIEYTDKLDRFLKETEDEIIIVAEKLNFDTKAIEAVKKHFIKTKETLLIDSYQKGVIQEVYEEIISSMSEKLVDEVKERFIGYTVENSNNLVALINKTKSVNELLYVIHLYISNNDKLLKAMPVIATKKNQINQGYPITLYGEKTELSQELFNKFPLNLDCGETNIISMQNRILMMIRDRGHALTIDIDNTEKENDILIKYFIPKLCNIEMIKRLPGINKISSDNAVGMFESERKDISKNIFNFIEKVPTDLDIPYFHRPIQESTYLFGEEDAKQIAMEKSEEGVRTGRIQEFEKEIKRDIDKDNKEGDLKEPNQKRIGEEYDGATKD